MPKNKPSLGSDLAKFDATTDEEIARHMAEDGSPELTDEWFDNAEVWQGDRYLGRFARRRVGRPKGSGQKELVTLRLDREVLAHFRAGGPGWQTRVNDTLRATVAAAERPRRRQAAAE